jgi:hypothetical protein
MVNAIEAGKSIALLDDRLEAATRSDDPDVIRNAITALALLKGRSRLKLLANVLGNLIRRVRSEGTGDSGHFALLEHAHKSLKSLDAESLQTVREQVEAMEDRAVSVAVLALLPEDPTARKASMFRSWLVARNAWPSFGFWRLLAVAAGAVALAMLAMWLLLLAMAYGSGTGANPWGLRELSVLLTIVVIASLIAAMSGWIGSAGGVAKFGASTVLLDSIIWGAIASFLGAFILWVLPDLLPFIAWVRGGSGALMARWLVVTWALLFVVTTGSRWLSSWLVEHKPDSSRTRLVLLSAGVPAFLASLFVMLGLGGLHLLRGEMIGVWLLVVALAFAVAAVSVAVETPAARMEVLRARDDKHVSLTPWVIAVMSALFLTVVARPVFTRVAATGNVELDIPLPGARIIAVEPETMLELRLEGTTVGNALLLVKNTRDATSRFATSPRSGGSMNVITRGNSLVVCVLSVDDLTGGTTSPFCEQPSLRWIADIFNAPTSIGTRALVSIRTLPARHHDPLYGFDRPAMRYLTAATSQISISEPTMLYVSLVGAPRFDRRHPENTVVASVERLRNDGFSAGASMRRGGYGLEAGTYLLCARRPRREAASLRRTPSLIGLRQGIPSSYQLVTGTSCDSTEQRLAPGVGIAVVSIPDKLTFRDAGMARRGGTVVAGSYVPIHVNVPTLLVAEFEGSSTAGDTVLVLTRVAAGPGEAPRQTSEAQTDPEAMVAALAPGDYHLCARQFDMDSEAELTCAPPGLDGVLTYRLIPVASLPRSPAN